MASTCDPGLAVRQLYSVPATATGLTPAGASAAAVGLPPSAAPPHAPPQLPTAAAGTPAFRSCLVQAVQKHLLPSQQPAAMRALQPLLQQAPLQQAVLSLNLPMFQQQQQASTQQVSAVRSLKKVDKHLQELSQEPRAGEALGLFDFMSVTDGSTTQPGFPGVCCCRIVTITWLFWCIDRPHHSSV